MKQQQKGEANDQEAATKMAKGSSGLSSSQTEANELLHKLQIFQDFQAVVDVEAPRSGRDHHDQQNATGQAGASSVAGSTRGKQKSKKLESDTAHDRFIMEVVQERQRLGQEGRERPKTDENIGAVDDGEFSSAAAVPPTVLSRVPNNAVATNTLPGAYFVAPGLALERTSSFSTNGTPVGLPSEDEVSVAEGDPDCEQGNASGDDHSGLAVANPVDEIMTDQLPQAHQVSDHQTEEHDQKKSKRIIQTVMGSILVLAAIFILLLLALLLLPGNGDRNPIANVTPRPSVAPTSSADYAQEYVLSLLDRGTVQSLEYADSPQSKAFQWLLQEDPDKLLTYSQDRIRQKFALATLYFATGSSSSWTNHTHWLDHSVHECDWFTSPGGYALKAEFQKRLPGYLDGVLEPMPESPCDPATGLYQHLWLDKNNLVGSLPTELYLLTHLQSMSLGWNQLKGTISTYIGRLTALQGLTFLYNLHTGTIPSQVGMLSNLEALHLASNQLEGSVPDELWKLTNLAYLVLSDNPLRSTLPTELGNFSKLRRLVLTQCGFYGTIPSELMTLESLDRIIMIGNELNGGLPSELGKNTHLKWIALVDNLLDAPLPTEIGLAASMAQLQMGHNQLQGPIPSELGLLPGLEYLSFHNNYMSQAIPTELGILTQLTDLELANNQFSGMIPSELGQLTSLLGLTLANNSLSGPVPEELSSLHASAHTIALDGNPLLAGSIPPSLCVLNGTCVGSFLFPCVEPFGLSFDCAEQLCGCDCPCVDTDSGK